MTPAEHTAWRKKENERKRLWKQQKQHRRKGISSPQPSGPDEKLYTKEEVKELMIRFAKETLPPQEPEKPRKQTRRERKMMRLRKQLETMEQPEKPVEIPIKPTHLKGKGIQFRPDVPKTDALPIERRTVLSKKFRKKYDEIVPPAHEPDQLETTEEQVERPMTTKHCPESIKEDRLSEVRRSPENYIEINIILSSRVVDSFYIPSDKKHFHYKTKQYDISEEAIYLLPTKAGFFVPSSYWKEGIPSPKGFKQTNRGITGKAMSLLYMEQLYTSLLYTDETRYNLFIVILSIALLISFVAGLYLTVFYNGGVFPQPITPMPPIGGG